MFELSIDGLNSEFSFSKITYLIKTKPQWLGAVVYVDCISAES